MIDPHHREKTRELLSRMTCGDDGAASLLLPLVYERLRELAARYVAGRGPERTLQPTALVHEAFLELQGREIAWEDKAHFLAVCAKAMRDILVDRERRRRARKRGGELERVTLRGLQAENSTDEVDLLALDEALAELGELDPRQARIVELRFFSGMSGNEIALAVGVSRNTVVRELTLARAWLLRKLDGGRESE